MALVTYRCPQCNRCIPVRLWPLSCVCGHFTFDGFDSLDPVACTEPRTFVPEEPHRRHEPVGDCLKQALAELRIAGNIGCGCQEMASKMNGWGIAGCVANRAEIVSHLNEQAAKRRWLEKARAAVLGAVWLDLLDPAGSLLDEALRRAATL